MRFRTARTEARQSFEELLEAGRAREAEPCEPKGALEIVAGKLLEIGGEDARIGIAHEAEAKILGRGQRIQEAARRRERRQQRRARARMLVRGRVAAVVQFEALQGQLDRRAGGLGHLDIDVAQAPRPVDQVFALLERAGEQARDLPRGACQQQSHANAAPEGAVPTMAAKENAMPLSIGKVVCPTGSAGS